MERGTRASAVTCATSGESGPRGAARRYMDGGMTACCWKLWCSMCADRPSVVGWSGSRRRRARRAVWSARADTSTRAGKKKKRREPPVRASCHHHHPFRHGNRAADWASLASFMCWLACMAVAMAWWTGARTAAASVWPGTGGRTAARWRGLSGEWGATRSHGYPAHRDHRPAGRPSGFYQWLTLPL